MDSTGGVLVPTVPVNLQCIAIIYVGLVLRNAVLMWNQSCTEICVLRMCRHHAGLWSEKEGILREVEYLPAGVASHTADQLDISAWFPGELKSVRVPTHDWLQANFRLVDSIEGKLPPPTKGKSLYALVLGTCTFLAPRIWQDLVAVRHD